MFFWKKRSTEKKVEETFHKQLMEQFQILSRELKDEKDAISALCSDVKQNGKDILRHGMALEDCVEMLEEWNSDKEQARKQKQEARKEQEKLLGLCSAYQEQLWSMKRYAKEHDAFWYQQLLLMEKVIEESMIASGITMITKTDCAVNYELHEVMEIRETEEPHKDKVVADIVRPGYCYKGEVRQKAKVVVYRVLKTKLTED